jgi:hypothetical protein
MDKKAGVSNAIAGGVIKGVKGIGNLGLGAVKGIFQNKVGRVVAPLAIGGAAIYGGAKILQSIRKGTQESQAQQLPTPIPDPRGYS